MDFYKKYISQKEFDEKQVKPDVDKNGNSVPETRIVLTNEGYAQAEQLYLLKLAIQTK